MDIPMRLFDHETSRSALLVVALLLLRAVTLSSAISIPRCARRSGDALTLQNVDGKGVGSGGKVGRGAGRRVGTEATQHHGSALS